MKQMKKSLRKLALLMIQTLSKIHKRITSVSEGDGKGDVVVLVEDVDLHSESAYLKE